MKYIIVLVMMIFVLEGMGPVIFHRDIYDARKQGERDVFQEYAIPPDSVEVSDNSFEKSKLVVLIKEYRVNSTKESLEKYYEEKLGKAGWIKEDEIDGVLIYRRGDLRLDIDITIPKVNIFLTYDGDDKDF